MQSSLSVSGVVTARKGGHVSVLEFFYLFILKRKNLSRVMLTSCHVAMIVWCDSDNVTCHYYARCHFHILNLVLYF